MYPETRPIDDQQHVILMNEIIRGFLSVASDGTGALPPAPDPLFKDPRPIGTPPSYVEIGEALGLLARTYALKNVKYGSSWCRRGPLEIFFNISRKFDRVENLLVLEGRADAMRPDDFVDLANYSLMQLAYHLSAKKGQFVTWAQSLFHQGIGL